LISTLQGLRGKRVVVLATGDPLWFSVGARIGREIDPSEITYHPQLSAFQLASARMGWSMADVETLTVHGRPVEQMIAFIQPDQRLLILTTGAQTPWANRKILDRARLWQLKDDGFGCDGGERENSALTGWRRVGPMRCRRLTPWLLTVWRRLTPHFCRVSRACLMSFLNMMAL
jgi:precorrin-6Y C5,15-methyltransferase (decarboxylating)